MNIILRNLIQESLKGTVALDNVNSYSSLQIVIGSF